MKFRMVDSILYWEAHRAIRGVKAASLEEYMLRGPLGYCEQLPESLLLGGMIQLAAWLTILSSDFTQMALPGEVGQVQFPSPVGPGQRVNLELVTRASAEGLIVVDGRGHVGGRLVVDVAELRLSVYPLTDYHDPEDLRVLFSEIHRPAAEAVR